MAHVSTAHRNLVNKPINLDREYEDRVCMSAKCGKQVPEGISTLLCVEHLRTAWASYELLKGTDADKFREPAKKNTSALCHDAHGSVYFAQVGRYVKIGWSSNVPKRLRELKANALYVTVPGTRADEKAFHKTFHKYLADGAEYFHPTPVLMNYIKQLQSEAA